MPTTLQTFIKSAPMEKGEKPHNGGGKDDKKKDDKKNEENGKRAFFKLIHE